jgi:CheY-like chemotaxis protein
MPAPTELREHCSESKLQSDNNLQVNTRILLVEDNIINQQIAKAMLSKLGFNADISVNGREAIEALKKVSYALVIMDLQMPLMGGIEAAIEIRKQETGTLNPDIPIIPITANATEDDMRNCRNAGMNDFIKKPFSINTLRDVLQKWIPVSKL